MVRKRRRGRGLAITFGWDCTCGHGMDRFRRSDQRDRSVWRHEEFGRW